MNSRSLYILHPAYNQTFNGSWKEEKYNNDDDNRPVLEHWVAANSKPHHVICRYVFHWDIQCEC